MSSEEMRAILCNQYGGAHKWVERVMKMSERQVAAVYLRMLNTGKLR